MTIDRIAHTRRRTGKTAFFTWAPPFLVFILIMTLSLTPGFLYPRHPEIYNVAVHFLEFVFLGFFLARALTRTRDWGTPGLAALAVFLCALSALTTEILQFTVPQRTFDVMDIIVDILGAFTGTFLYISAMKFNKAPSPGRGDFPETEDV